MSADNAFEFALPDFGESNMIPERPVVIAARRH
jgi:hypothetical protein